MAKPWEKYQEPSKEENSREESLKEHSKKPWEKYSKEASIAEEKAPEEESYGHAALRHAIDVVPPVVGAMGGAALGSGLGPIGTAAGGGIGYAAGQELSGLARHHLLGEELPSTEPIEQAKRVGGNVLMGGAAELGAPILAKGAEAVAGAVPAGINAVAKKLAMTAAGLSKGEAKTGEALLEEGVIAPLASKEQTQEAARGASKRVGEEIGTTLDQIKENANPLKIVSKLQEKINEYSRLPGSEKVVKKLQDIQELFLEHSKLGNKEEIVSAAEPNINAIQSIQDKINRYKNLLGEKLKTPSSEPDLNNIFKKEIKSLKEQEKLLKSEQRLTEPEEQPGQPLKTWSARELEEIKRKYADLVNYERKQRLPQTTEANKEAASIFRNEVEGMANKAGSEIEQPFMQAKERYGALAPVIKEANKPNLYHEIGKDAASYAAGEAYDKIRGGHGAGLALLLARRGLQVPQIASTGAVGANALGKGLQAAGQALPGAAATAGRIGSYLITPKAVQKSTTPLQGLINHVTPTVTQPALPKNDQSSIMHSGMMKNLAKIDQQNPNLLSKSGLNLPELERHLANHASKTVNMQEFTPQTEAQRTQPIPKGDLMSRFKKIKTPSGPAQVGRAVYEQSPEQLRGMADSLQASGDENKSHMGNALIKALDNKDYIAKNAILFNLLQNPSTRKLIKSELPEDQGSVDENGQEDIG